MNQFIKLTPAALAPKCILEYRYYVTTFSNIHSFILIDRNNIAADLTRKRSHSAPKKNSKEEKEDIEKLETQSTSPQC